MGKMVGAAEFKTHCLRFLKEVERTGEPLTITNRGRVVGVLNPPAREKPKFTFGFMKGSIKVFGDIVGPIEPDWESEWEASNPPELYR